MTGEAINWEEQLVTLLDELSEIQTDLLAALDQKREAMAAGKLAEMDELQQREQHLGDRLQACHQRRGQLLRAAGERGLPSDNLGRLATAVTTGKPGQLSGQVKTVSDRMRLLQEHSLTNWVLAQRSLLHVSQMLEIVARGGRLQPTYGTEPSLGSRGALVDREV